MPADFTNDGSHLTNQAEKISIENQYNTYRERHDTGPFCTVPGQDAYCELIGRQDVIHDLAERFKSWPYQSIAGTSGIGKSHTALTFAHAMHKPTSQLTYSVKHIFMVPIDTTASFCAGYERIAHAVGIANPSEQNQSCVLSQVYNWLNGKESESWLLVLDNVYYDTLYECPHPPTHEFPPKTSTPTLRALLPDANSKLQRFILITTHDFAVTGLYGGETMTISLPDLRVYGACQLLDSRLSEPQRKDQRAPSLVEALDRNALAITTTSKYIRRLKDTQTPLKDCLELIQSEGLRRFLERQRQFLPKRTAVEPLRCSVSWKHILQRVWQIRKEAVHAFGVLSCFDECCVPFEILKACPRWNERHRDLDECLGILQNYYLVSDCEDHHGKKIQRLIRITSEIWFETLSSPNDSSGWKDYQNLWQYEALQALFALNRDPDSNSEELRERLIFSHLNTFAWYLKRKENEKQLERLRTDVSEMIVTFTRKSIEKGKYEQSQRALLHVVQGGWARDELRVVAILELAEAMRSRKMSEEDREKLLKDASDLLWSAHQIVENLKDGTYGKHKTQLMINIYSTRSLIYRDRKKIEKAITMQEKAVDLSQKTFGKREEYLDAQTVLGRVFHHGASINGDYLESAFECFTDVLKLLEGSNCAVADEKERKYRLHTAEASLARVYHSKNDWAKACEYAQRAYTGRQRLLGDEKIKTLSAGMDLAACLHERGNKKEAEEQFQRLLETAQHVYGSENEQVKEWKEMVEEIMLSDRFSGLSLSESSCGR